jgi:hypothetical protein
MMRYMYGGWNGGWERGWDAIMHEHFEKNEDWS